MTREVRIGVGIIGAGFARSTQVPAFRAFPGVDVLSLASAAGLPDNEWARDGWRNQLVLDAARRSHEARRWVVP